MSEVKHPTPTSGGDWHVINGELVDVSKQPPAAPEPKAAPKPNAPAPSIDVDRKKANKR